MFILLCIVYELSSAGDLAVIDGVCSCNRNEGYYGRDRYICAIDNGKCRKAGYQLTIDGMWYGMVWFMVFNATFNNLSLISWQSVLLVEETGVPGKNHWPVASNWQTL